jgi:hypothetical protein
LEICSFTIKLTPQNTWCPMTESNCRDLITKQV